jgi:hypothetical protein
MKVAVLDRRDPCLRVDRLAPQVPTGKECPPATTPAGTEHDTWAPSHAVLRRSHHVVNASCIAEKLDA